MADSVKIDYLNDWETRLLGRLYTQFRDATSWRLWVTDVIAPQAQALEDGFQTLLTLLDVDNSQGVQLDRIGRLIGQARLGVTDVVYRTYLRARIQANRSDGAPEALYRVFRALYGATIGQVITTSNIGVKAFVHKIKSAITFAQAIVGVGFLRDAKEAGARAILQWQEAANSAMFAYGGPGTGVDPATQGYGIGIYAGARQA